MAALTARVGQLAVTGPVSIGALLWAALVVEARTGAGGAVTVIPTLTGSGGVAVYSLSQAFGVMALVWAWWSTLVGLVMASRPLSKRTRRWRVLDRTHRGSGITTIALIFTHALLPVFDHLGDNPISSFVIGFPAAVPGRPSVPVGILAFYLALILGLSYHLRTRIGPRRWRTAHRLVIGVYALGVWHALGMGSDLHPGSWAWVLVCLAQVPPLIALLRRLTQPLRASERISLRRQRPPEHPTRAAAVPRGPRRARRPAPDTAPAQAADPARTAATTQRAAAPTAQAPTAAAPRPGPRRTTQRPGTPGQGTSPTARPARAALPPGAADRTDPALTYLRRLDAAAAAHLLEQLGTLRDPALLAAAAAIAQRNTDLQLHSR